MQNVVLRIVQPPRMILSRLLKLSQVMKSDEPQWLTFDPTRRSVSAGSQPRRLATPALTKRHYFVPRFDFGVILTTIQSSSSSFSADTVTFEPIFTLA